MLQCRSGCDRSLWFVQSIVPYFNFTLCHKIVSLRDCCVTTERTICSDRKHMLQFSNIYDGKKWRWSSRCEQFHFRFFFCASRSILLHSHVQFKLTSLRDDNVCFRHKKKKNEIFCTTETTWVGTTYNVKKLCKPGSLHALAVVVF